MDASGAGGINHSLRVGDTVEIIAAARSQSGKVLESIPVTLTIEENKAEAITLEDGMLEAVGAGSAKIKAESELAGISGTLTVNVSNPVDKVVFEDMDGNRITELNLAIGEEAVITAVALDADDDEITHDKLLSNWSWDPEDASVATVTQQKNAEKKLVMKGAIGTVTGEGHGDAMITAMVEGVSGSIDVSVSPGQSTTRFMRASTSNHPNNTFTWDKSDGAWDRDTITFGVSLYDEVSRDQIEGGTIEAASSDESIITVNDPAATTGIGTDVIVTPVFDGASASAGEREDATITLSSVGATPIKVNFTVIVKE